jgi:high affinity Mn2+ porin
VSAGAARRARRWGCWVVVVLSSAAAATPVAADEALAPSAGATAAPGADSYRPALLAAQYTYVLQHQTALDAPYSGRLSLLAQGDTQPTNTIGFYGGWAVASWAQLYLDTEKFMGAGVSGATGLGGLTNGDVVREGAVGLKKTFYIARAYVRLMWPLGNMVAHVARGQDQIAGNEATTRVEFKAGLMAVTDDFDHNRYAGATRTQFMNWSLWANTAWDYAANTRGFTDGFVLSYLSPAWSLRYGLYRMPLYANGQTLETLNRAQGENLELTLAPWTSGLIVRLLGYRNTAAMGNYREALAIGAANATVPDVAADGRNGRHKYGFGVNAELPLADAGDTGLFMRAGWDDGATETFVFTEVDRQLSGGVQLSGVHWGRASDVAGLGLVCEGLSGPHRDYLAAGGSGFVLGDGQLAYAHEQILELYYRLQLFDSLGRVPLRLQLSPDFQFIRNPGFNEARGPVRFYGVRLHLEY